MKNSNDIDFLSGKAKISNINKGIEPIITRRKTKKKIFSIIPFCDDGLEAFSSQPNMFVESEHDENSQIIPDRAMYGLDAQNPSYKIIQIMGNTQAKLIAESNKDHGRTYNKTPISELTDIPDWLRNDLTLGELINTGIGGLIFYIHYSKETIKEMKLKFDKGFVYFDGLKYIFKKISCTKKVGDEIFEMNEEEYKEMGKLEMQSFLKT
ncbi:MAG: hypothetical protein PHZ26_03680 [Candidatus Gracilibacteria bacterium]|nr:hypothetical protein [Candidatus Gracilibacteria bacterium]MDD2908828.1 hypothetical protein [Candidatus Gracilibacteria bacterium]